MKETYATAASALVIVSVVLINFVTMPAMEYRGDAQAVRMQSISILRDGRWTVPEEVARRFGPRGNYFYQTNEGKWYPKFGVLNTIVYLPFLALEKAMKGEVRYDGDHVLVLNLLSLLAAAAAAFYLFRLAQRYTESLWIAVVFVFVSFYATFWWHYLRAHAFEAYMVPLVLGFFFHFLTKDLAVWRRHLFVSGVFLAALCLIKIVFVIFVPIAFVFLLKAQTRDKDRAAWRGWLRWFAAPVLVGLALLAFSNWYRFGSAFNSGYTQWAEERHLFGGNVFTALRGYLFGAQTSVFLHYPLLVFALFFWPGFIKRHPVDGWLAMSLGVAFILVHAARPNWSGAVCYGPRYVLPVAPLLALPFIDFLNWLQTCHHPTWRWTAAVAAGVLLTASCLLQFAVNSLPFYFDREIGSSLADAGETSAVDYFEDYPEGKIALDFLLYARGWKSELSEVAAGLSPDGFAELEAWKATTRFNYYWYRRPVERSVSLPR